MSKEKKVFVIGWEDFNIEKLNHLPESRECEFLPAIYFSEMRRMKQISIPRLLEIADERIREVGNIDAIVNYFDFPGSVLIPIITAKYCLTGPSLTSVLKCEHKYWSRIEQQKVIPENIPDFKAFDIYDDSAYDKIPFTPPFWIKPVKSYHSYLAFKITGPEQFNECIDKVRKNIDSVMMPFTHILNEYRIEGEVPGITEKMIAETEIAGNQCTAEGYVFNAEPHVYGIVDSVSVEGGSSFLRYEYPSSLPPKIAERMTDLSKKVIVQTGLMNSAFNIEYFYNKRTDQIKLLEINPRISQAHSDLFEKVHGISHHEVMLNLALNRRPEKFQKKGDFNVAAHFMHRCFKSGIVKEVPSDKKIEDIKKKYPDLKIKVNIEKGVNLDDLPPHHVDSYSYVLANIFLGAHNRKALLTKYNDVIDRLAIQVDFREN